ncbi:MAG TPA: DUF6644 family protein [Micropepsaceae bacterium]|jgi:hypothetical protein|nr:DUF6644 family protein [Micropepsaceae bacterium]
MIDAFSQWLSDTALSSLLADTTHLSTWLIIPLSQCIHILSVAVIMISVCVLNFHMLGIGTRQQTFAQLAGQLIPWTWGALIALFLTGALQTIAEPSRELLNIGFRVKMVMLLITVGITLFYQITLKKDPKYWDVSPQRRQTGRILATFSLFLWVGIAAAGRLIAYLDMRQG